MRSRRKFFAKLIKNELRTIIALGLVLLILVGFGLAADTTYRFDFGPPGQSSPSGYIPVLGATSLWPQTSDGVQYGWSSGAILVSSSGASVEDVAKRDSNYGADEATFRLGGLEDGAYIADILVGDLNNGYSTVVFADGKSFQASTDPGEWQNISFGLSVSGGSIDFDFQSGGQAWGISSLTLTPTSSPPAPPTFDFSIQPAEHTIRVGGTVVYKLSLSPLSGYASPVNLSIAGILETISAQIVPPSGIPPFTADLIIRTASNTPPVHYDFVVTAVGTDPMAHTINRNISLTVTDTPHVPVVDEDDDAGPGPNFSDSEQDLIDDAHFRPLTEAEAEAAQRLIDQYAREEAEKLANPDQLEDINEIDTINSFPVIEVPPAPKTAFEATLRRLAESGTIGSVVDTAPPAPAALTATTEPVGFWDGFLSKLFNPTPVT